MLRLVFNLLFFAARRDEGGIRRADEPRRDERRSDDFRRAGDEARRSDFGRAEPPRPMSKADTSEKWERGVKPVGPPKTDSPSGNTPSW